MNFTNIFSEWKNKGSEPSDELKNNGFQPGYKPPANIFNWFWSKVIAAVTELQEKLSKVDKQSNGILTDTIYDNTSPSGYQITITVPNLSDDPFEKDNENSLDGKIIAVSMKNYTATSDNANMKLNVNTKSTDLWHYPKGKNGDTGRVHSFKAYEIRPQSVLLIAIKDHYGYVLNPPSPLKLEGKISDNAENDVDYITGKLAADYAAEFNRFVGSNAYAVDISKVNKVGYNQALCIEIPGITEWADLNGKVIAVTTGAYCWTGKGGDNKTPDKLYLRVNDEALGDKLQNTIKRQIPSYTGVDYDTEDDHTYFTDYFMPGEIARYQTLFIGFRDTNIMLLNPPPAMRATKVITANSTDDISYVTPKLINEHTLGSRNNPIKINASEADHATEAKWYSIDHIEIGGNIHYSVLMLVNRHSNSDTREVIQHICIHGNKEYMREYASEDWEDIDFTGMPWVVTHSTEQLNTLRELHENLIAIMDVTIIETNGLEISDTQVKANITITYKNRKKQFTNVSAEEGSGTEYDYIVVYITEYTDDRADDEATRWGDVGVATSEWIDREMSSAFSYRYRAKAQIYKNGTIYLQGNIFKGGQ